MNKFFVLLLAAFVCGAFAAPQNETVEQPSEAAFENDDVEAGSLSPEHQVFADFCKGSRDEVKAYIKKQVNQGASFLFKSAGEQILNAAAKVGAQQKEAVDQGAELIGQDAKNAGQATNGVFNAIIDGVKNGAQEAFEQFTELFSKDNLRAKVFGGCDAVLDELKPQLEQMLEVTKKGLSEAANGNEQLQAAIGATTLENVGCITTGRFTKIAKSCLTLKNVGEEALKSINL